MSVSDKEIIEKILIYSATLNFLRKTGRELEKLLEKKLKESEDKCFQQNRRRPKPKIL
jgi:hypothetical protein